MKTGSLLAIVLLALIALIHLYRVIVGIDVMIGDVAVPEWISIIGFIVPAGIAYMLWKESK